MSCRFWSFAAALSAAVVLNSVHVSQAADDPPAGEQAVEQPQEESPAVSDAKPVEEKSKVEPVTDAKGIEEALLKKTDAKFSQMPLREIASWLEENKGIQVEIDIKTLTDAGMDVEAIEVNFEENNLALASALYHLLRQYDLAFVVTNDVLLITTEERANTLVETRVYPALDLLAFRQADGSLRDDANPLSTLVQAMCSPESWETAGGVGTINTLDGLLTVKQNRRVHEQIAALLEILRSAKQAAAEGTTFDARKVGENAAVYSALEKSTIEPNWPGVSLLEVTGLLQDSAKVPFIVDVHALVEAGLSDDSIYFWLKDRRIPVRKALMRIMPQSELAYVVQKGAVVIASKEQASAMLEVCAYPIGDLLSDELKIGESPVQRGRSLQTLVMDAAGTSTWDDKGGMSRIEFAAPWNLLVVSAPAATQQEVADVLAKLREAKVKQAESGLAPSETATTDDPVLLRVFKLGSVADGNQEAADKIAELVRELVPETRASNADNPEGPYLRTVSDRMVVMNRRSVLVKVESLLDQFDAAAGGKFRKETAAKPVSAN